MRYRIAIFTAAVLAAQETPVIRVPVRMVEVPTLVFSKDHRLIPGLRQSDFRVLDNGVPQTVQLNAEDAPVSVVVAIQADLDVRRPAKYIAKVGSVMEAHLVGATGRAAVIAYNGEIRTLKPFGSGDVREAFEQLAPKGFQSHMIDAGMQAILMLKQRPRAQARVLLFIGQPFDKGSKAGWADLQTEADRENVSIHALTLPDSRGDPLLPLIDATGGRELHVHSQRDLEDAISTLGVELRSAYLLSFYPNSEAAGPHRISVEVAVPGAKTHARPGYVLSPN